MSFASDTTDRTFDTTAAEARDANAGICCAVMGGRAGRIKTSNLPADLLLLKNELELRSVRLPQLPTAEEAGFLAELAYALSPPIHEEMEASFGMIWAPREGLARLKRIQPEVDQPAALSIARRAANGVTSFVYLLNGARRFVMFREHMGTESTLTQLAAEIEGLIVQRDPRGTVRIFTSSGVYVNQGRRWWHKHSWRSLADNVRRHVPQGSNEVLERILTLAVHVLSPANTGATLLWWLVEPQEERYLNRVDLRPLQLRVHPDHYLAIQSLICQYDGASVISPSGDILSTGIHLQVSDRARDIVPETKGTRHTSSRRYSFDEARVLAVTVSQDGPVSVFSDGAQLGEVKPYSAEADALSLGAAIPEKSEDMSDETSEAQCSNCGKTMQIETFVVTGWRDREEAHCQICGAQVASRMCFKIDAFVRKTF